jgi:hypothetical protein
MEGKQLLSALSEAVNIYFNYTGTAQCLNISQQATSDLGDLGWDYQVGLSLVHWSQWCILLHFHFTFTLHFHFDFDPHLTSPHLTSLHFTMW